MPYSPQPDSQHLRSQCRIVAAVLAALMFVASGAKIAAAATPRAKGGWHEIDTSHFRISRWQAPAARSDDSHIELACEGAMAQLAMYWFGRVEPLNQKVDIILHPSDESYCRQVGDNATQTAGSVLIRYGSPRPVFRIDLRANRSDWETAGLPHELTHVLFAQRFAGRKLPSWINEGTALLADSASKQALHLRDCHLVRTSGTALPFASLMSLTDYPGQRDWPAFYGQSLSLVKCLVERKSPQAFVEFIDKSLEQDYAIGLREVYNISGVGELQQIWSQYVSRPDAQLARVHSSPRNCDSRKIKSPGK
jgi:hypothetical protein